MSILEPAASFFNLREEMAHFVKARVKVNHYPDGSHAVFHGPRCIGQRRAASFAA